MLAPAGNLEILKVAIQAGCDAVYISGKDFGARKFANNFTNEEMIEAITYAHLRNIKIYVTVNTIIFEDEVEVNDINAFIKNFLEDPSFRKEKASLVEGKECLEVFDFTNSEGTNIECFNQITKLNHQKEVSKQELMILRTNGIDKFSTMNLDLIEEFIESTIMQYFYRELKSKINIVKACRWYMRGLKKELCVKKVKIDLELTKEKI